MNSCNPSHRSSSRDEAEHCDNEVIGLVASPHGQRERALVRRASLSSLAPCLNCGHRQACALLANGTVSCWGDNAFGMVMTLGRRLRPTNEPSGHGTKASSAFTPASHHSRAESRQLSVGSGASGSVPKGIRTASRTRSQQKTSRVVKDDQSPGSRSA